MLEIYPASFVVDGHAREFLKIVEDDVFAVDFYEYLVHLKLLLPFLSLRFLYLLSHHLFVIISVTFVVVVVILRKKRRSFPLFLLFSLFKWYWATILFLNWHINIHFLCIWRRLSLWWGEWVAVSRCFVLGVGGHHIDDFHCSGVIEDWVVNLIRSRLNLLVFLAQGLPFFEVLQKLDHIIPFLISINKLLLNFLKYEFTGIWLHVYWSHCEIFCYFTLSCEICHLSFLSKYLKFAFKLCGKL